MLQDFMNDNFVRSKDLEVTKSLMLLRHDLFLLFAEHEADLWKDHDYENDDCRRLLLNQLSMCKENYSTTRPVAAGTFTAGKL